MQAKAGLYHAYFTGLILTLVTRRPRQHKTARLPIDLGSGALLESIILTNALRNTT